MNNVAERTIVYRRTKPLPIKINEKFLIGLSGGINSAAVLCHLIESGIVPKELHLFYAHFEEHSPDTYPFVKALIRLARKKFPCVKIRITRNSIMRYFFNKKIIPHPMLSPCSKDLKIIPVNKYAFENDIKIDLIGYVKTEMKTRAERQQKRIDSNLKKLYPIGSFTDEWCFGIVKSHLGWYPAIYDIRDEKGKRIFTHNNCLPCKNMSYSQMNKVAIYYPSYHKDAMLLSEKLKSHWGRDADEFYTQFGVDDNLGTDGLACEFCRF